MSLDQYIDLFITETKENLDSLNNLLLELENDMNNLDIINEIFRVAHTLKGMAGTMGFEYMTSLTHDMENVLDALRSKKVNVNIETIDILFKCLDSLDNMLTSIMEDGKESDENVSDLKEKLKRVLSGESINGTGEAQDNTKSLNEEQKDTSEQIILTEYDADLIKKAIGLNKNVFKLNVGLASTCVLKSARAFMIFQAIEKKGEIIKAVPPVQDIEEERFDLKFKLLIITDEDNDTIKKSVDSISEVDEVVVEDINLDNEKIKNSSYGNENVKNNKETKGKDKEKNENAQKNKPKVGKTVRVDINRLDSLINLVSELIIVKTRLDDIKQEVKAPVYNETIEYLERITTSLHDAVMKVRMVPIDTVFSRFPRMIRDISKELGKNIKLRMTGEETELDRTVIDEIGDPLIHLLRNSIDHGLESTAERIAAGKGEEGNINLRAYQAGNNVIIEVEDDGQGINVEKVKNKAVQLGILNKNIADTLPQKDIVNILFRPSFSTADKVTDLSGRGVGLDVVKTKIEELGGNIEVDTEKGKGTKFLIRLPLTLAILQALMVMVEDEKYAIPLGNIKEIIKISSKDIKYIQQNEVIILRDEVVPIQWLNRMLGIEREEEEATYTAVIIKKSDNVSGLLVDKLIGQQEIIIKSLGKMLSSVKLIAGATILGDGNVALILDINAII